MTFTRVGNGPRVEPLHSLSDPRLAEAVDESFGRSWVLLAGTPPLQLERSASMTRVLTGIASPMCNGIYRARFGGRDVGARIEAALQPFAARDLPASWWVGPGTRPSNLGRHLQDRGLRRDVVVPGMAIELAELDPIDRSDAIDSSDPAPPGGPDSSITCERVVNQRQLGLWVEIFQRVFDLPAPVPELFLSGFGRLGFDQPNVRHYLATLAGEPVGCGSMFGVAGVAGIYNVATLPQARGRGIGSLLVTRPLRQARVLGYRIGALHATEAGLNAYRRLGFRQVCEIERYLWSG